MSRHNRWIITILLILAGLLLPNPKVTASCGDGICQSNESVNSCQMDCGQRQAVHLVLADWASNVVRYGDLDNDGDNDIITIQSKPVPQSHSCGNNMCETGEDALSCSDCQIGICGNNSCESGESQSCSSDCGPKVYDYNVITAMAAFDLDRCGNLMNCTGQEAMLWSIGTPNSRHSGLPQTDLPVQIGDFDSDGSNDVAYIMDWQLVVADGKTLAQKKRIPTPKDPWTPNPSQGNIQASDYGRLVGEQLLILPGSSLPRLLVKNRYYTVWAYNQQLEEMWRYDNCGQRNDLGSDVKPCVSGQTTNTGHMPYPIRWFDADPHFEMLIGHSFIDDTGKQLWRINPNPSISWYHAGHFDGGLLWKSDGAASGSWISAMASSDLGMYFLDGKSGNVIKHYPFEQVKHAQSMGVANFRPETTELEVVVANKNHGQLFMFSAEGELLDEYTFNDSAHHRIMPLFWNESEQGILMVDALSWAVYDGHFEKVMQLSNFDTSNPLAIQSDYRLYVDDFIGDSRDELLFANRWRIAMYENPLPSSGGTMKTWRIPNQSNYSAELLEVVNPGSPDLNGDGVVNFRDYEMLIESFSDMFTIQHFNKLISRLIGS